MSFLNKSVNYSQIDLLKTNILKPLLKSYNDFLLNRDDDDDVYTQNSYDYFIPNNNKKYYLLITKKKLLEKKLDKRESQYEILYFFPDTQIENDLNTQISKDIKSTDDFFMEIDSVFKDDLLLEGYLYDNNGYYEYLISDFLIKNGDIVDVSFELRYCLLNELLKSVNNSVLKRLNDHMTINIHPIFKYENINFIKIFKNNFVYRRSIVCLEQISNFKKKRWVEKCESSDNKIILKTNSSDIYNVYDTKSNNYLGILYVKGIRESKILEEMFKDDDNITLKCSWNKRFYKWQPILI